MKKPLAHNKLPKLLPKLLSLQQNQQQQLSLQEHQPQQQQLSLQQQQPQHQQLQPVAQEEVLWSNSYGSFFLTNGLVSGKADTWRKVEIYSNSSLQLGQDLLQPL